MLGCACLWVASKYEEEKYISPESIWNVAEGRFSKEKLIMMEGIVLQTLQFYLTIASSYHFAEILLRITQCNGENTDTEGVSFLLYLSLQELHTYTFSPSVVASAAILLVRRQGENDGGHVPWTLTLEKYSTYSVQNLESCVRYLHELTESKHDRFLEVRRKFPQQAIRVWKCD